MRRTGKTTEEICWREGWKQIKRFTEKGVVDIISTGYEKLNNLLGGGLIKGSTNLVIEETGNTGHIFLILLLKKRIEKGDIGLIDCFFISPERLKEECKSWGIDLSKYNGSLYFLDFASRNSVKTVLGSDSLDTFASEYSKVVANLIPKGEIFNIDLSLSASATRYGEERIYRHLLREKKCYESYKRTAVYLVERNAHTVEFMNGLKRIFDSVINLKSITHNGRVNRILQIEKSPLPNYSTDETEYEISKNLGDIVFGGKK